MAKVKKVIYHEGRKFKKAKMSWPRGGVKHQYREAKAQHSGHMFVYRDGRRVVDHTDYANPEFGFFGPIKHFVFDILGVGGVAAVGTGAFVALLLAFRSAKKTDKKLEAVTADIKAAVQEGPQAQSLSSADADAKALSALEEDIRQALARLPQEAQVQWALFAAGRAQAASADPAVAKALDAARAWRKAPTPESRRAAYAAGKDSYAVAMKALARADSAGFATARAAAHTAFTASAGKETALSEAMQAGGAAAVAVAAGAGRHGTPENQAAFRAEREAQLSRAQELS